MDSEIQVVKRDTIPPIHAVDQGGHVHEVGELRDFGWSEELRAFMPDPPIFSASWVGLKHGEVLQPHTHPTQSMMIVYSGAGELVGDLCRSVEEGDAIVVPAGRAHGFIGGPNGMYALSIQFGEGLYTAPEKPRVIFADAALSLNALISYCDQRRRGFAEHLVFHWGSGALESSKRRVLRSAWEVLIEASRKVLAGSYANCNDPRYRPVFRNLLANSMASAQPSNENEQDEIIEIHDAVLEAAADWFVHQAYVLDDVEKLALTRLVLESACTAYRQPMVTPSDQAMGQADAGSGGELGMAELLRNQNPQTYARLKQIVREGWDMVEAAADRFVSVTRSA